MDAGTVPDFGLGTWSMTGAECTETVARALDIGYRHLDTAQLYDNEATVGAGLARSDVPREDVFLATKADPAKLGREPLRVSVEASLDRLGVDSVDCLYVHWPRDSYEPGETLLALDALVADGLVDGIGLSNFTPGLLDEALARLDAPVVAHQVECHPLLPQADLREYAREHGHALVAYSPLARGRALDLDPVRAIAGEREATPAQVVLAWAQAKGVVPIPKATGDHVRENFAARELTLTPDELARIDRVDARERLVDPPSAPWN
jgi:2,5-diketo-D-gluconate reductase B